MVQVLICLLGKEKEEIQKGRQTQTVFIEHSDRETDTFTMKIIYIRAGGAQVELEVSYD